MNPLRVALVGCGHMGRRHAATIAADPHAQLAVAVDLRPERAAWVAEQFGARPDRIVPTEVDAVVVATPTACHAEVARPLLDRGVACLVEKPLAPTVAQARELADGRCFVGHIERFNPAIVAATDLAPQVVMGRRVAPPTGRSMDVDVVFDLMIHDLDLVLGWGGDERWQVLDATGLGRPLVDTATVRLRSSTGRTASLLASRVAEHRERVLHCYERGRYTRLDLARGVVEQWQGRQRTPRRIPETAEDALTAQWRAFRSAVSGAPNAVATSSEAGLRAVQLAENIQEALNA